MIKNRRLAMNEYKNDKKKSENIEEFIKKLQNIKTDDLTNDQKKDLSKSISDAEEKIDNVLNRYEEEDDGADYMVDDSDDTYNY